MRARAWAGWAMWLVGCSSSGAGGPADAGGGTGAGGAGGAGPTSQASASLYLTTFANPMAGMACPASPHWVNVPFAAAGGQQAFANMKGTSAVDGVNDVSISCTVKPSGGMFDVS